MNRRKFWWALALVVIAALVALVASGALGEIIKTIRWVPGS
jgi:hypothetical protein